MVRVNAAVLAVAVALPCAAGSALRQRSLPDAEELFGKDPRLGTPDRTGYNPVEVLCAHGKEKDGSAHIQPWCETWVACIRQNAQPAGDQAAVKKAWSPADCREVCGEWPATTPAEGTSLLARSNHTKECQNSCSNFQDSLSSCVATILFEPGKVANMGMPKADAPAPAELCTMKDSPCAPDLDVQAQRCVGHKTKSKLSRGKHEVPADCAMINFHLEDCQKAKCGQVQSGFKSQYHTFVGGCMDQLNAYWQAANPNAGASAIPGATGCAVH